MGLFSFFRNKKTLSSSDENFEQMSVDEALKKYATAREGTREEVLELAKINCEQIAEVKRQLEEAKAEYEAVSAYLADILRIDMIPEESRIKIEEAAEQIVQSELEQKKFKQENKTLSDLQFHNLAQFEEDIERELPKLSKEEEYQMLVKEDLRQLEGEKGVQRYEIVSAIEKKNFIKKLSVASLILILGIFMMLLMLDNMTEADLMLPFFMSGVMSILLIFYIVAEERRCMLRLRKAEKNLNRAIMLINKVKIKYINCTSCIDYAYEKYHVNSYAELNYQWKEYCKMKERMLRFEKSSEAGKHYQGLLIKELRKYEVEDAEVWCYQAVALLDKKEMVEVRHHLNVRRQKLRERVDFNVKQMDLAMNAMMSLRSRHPECEDAIHKVMMLNS
jgi:hypothetical protein